MVHDHQVVHHVQGKLPRLAQLEDVHLLTGAFSVGNREVTKGSTSFRSHVPLGEEQRAARTGADDTEPPRLPRCWRPASGAAGRGRTAARSCERTDRVTRAERPSILNAESVALVK